MLYLGRLIAARINEFSRANRNSHVKIELDSDIMSKLSILFKKLNGNELAYLNFDNILAQYNIEIERIEKNSIFFINKNNKTLSKEGMCIALGQSLFLSSFPSGDVSKIKNISE